MTKEQIGAILKQLRLNCNMTQKEVAEKLGRKQQIVGHWETGYSQPDANTLFKLCEIYGTTIDEAFGFSSKKNITLGEYEHIKKYRDLDNHGRHIIDLLLKEEYERCKGVNTPKEPLQPFRIINYYQRLASAGTGQIVFDDIPTEMIQIPDVAKYKRVKYAIGVDGDSMYPDYCDGDVLLVEPTREIELGEVGIFMIDGKAFVKELGEKELISINPSYENIPLTAYTACLGRVIDKLESAELELNYPESDISELPSDSMRAIENDIRAHKKQDA